MAEQGSSGWVWALVIVVIIIIIAVIIIIALVAFESRNIDRSCNPNSPCPTGLTCVNGKCKLNDGETCEFNDQCRSGTCSGFPDFKCVSPTGATGTFQIVVCTEDSDCQSTERCDTKTGRCLLRDGQPCLLDGDCFSGDCKDKVCAGTSGVPTTSPTTTQISNMGSLQRPMNGVSLLGGMQEASTVRTNPTFNLESAPTRAEIMVNFRTPSPCEIDSPFKRVRKDMMMSRGDTKQSPAIDVTNYSNSTLALMKNGNIMRETDDSREIVANNINLRRLEGFNGTLYGISVDGRVFSLNNDTFDTRKWMWNLASFPTGVVHTSATHDGRHFWVQTADTGLLYDRSLRIKEKADMTNKKRVYGNDRETFVEIDTTNNTATLQPNDETIPDVAGAVITHDNTLKILKPRQTRLFSDIRLVNWTPAYIKRAL